MAEVAHFDLLVYRTLSVIEGWQFLQGKTGPPVDWTGYTFESELRAAVGGTVWARVTTTPSATGVITADPLTGIVTLRVAPTITGGFPAPPAVGVWDLIAVTADGERVPLLTGAAAVADPVTQPAP